MAAQRAFALVWAVVCGALLAAVSLVRFARMEPASYDNAIFEEAIRAYAHGGWPIVPIKGAGFNLLGDHFSPAIALIAPFYRVVPQAETLLVAQAALLALSVYVVSALAWRELGAWWGSAAGIAYGLSFGLQSAVVADFHEVVLGVPLIALAGSAFVDRRYGAVVGWSLPLLLVKEDLGMTVAAVGAALFLVGERRRGALLALGGAAAAVLVVLVLIPWARGDDTSYAYGLGGDSILATVADDPGRKALTVLLTLAVGGVVAAGSPWAIVALPTLAWRFASDNEFYWGTAWHYSVLLMPVAAVAGIDVLRRVHGLRPVGLAGMGIVTALSVIPNTVMSTPMTTYLNPDSWKPTARERAAERVLARVPPDTTVESDIGLITHLVSDNRVVTWIGTETVAGKPEWIVLDHDPASNIGSPPDAAEFASERYGVRYRTVLRATPFDVARRETHE